MTTQVTIARNSLDPSTWQTFETENAIELIIRQFDKWPDTARIYNQYVAEVCDVTPHDEASIERLNKLEGPLYVIVLPSDPVTIIAGIIISLALSAVSYLLQPKLSEPPSAATDRNIQATSPNNALTSRSNGARLNARIPDIFGTVRSTPDLIMLSYSLYENNIQVELSYMCIGRGKFAVSDVRDDLTLISEIEGTSVAVYGPNTSPNTGDPPQLLIGDAITETVKEVARSNAVDGQVLLAPNYGRYQGASDVRFTYPNIIETNNAGVSFSDLFQVGDTLTVATATFNVDVNSAHFKFKTIDLGGGHFNGQILLTDLSIDLTRYFAVGMTVSLIMPDLVIDSVNLSEDYVIAALTSQSITISDPQDVNVDWDVVFGLPGNITHEGSATLRHLMNLNNTGYTVLTVTPNRITLNSPALLNTNWNFLQIITSSPYISPLLSSDNPHWQGPYIIENMDKIICNFQALQGLYKDDGTNQYGMNVDVQIGIQRLDSHGIPIGSEELFTGTLVGSSITRDQRAVTVQCVPTFTGKCRVRAQRLTDKDFAFSGQVVDEVKWSDLYGAKEVGDVHFGNITTVHSKTIATRGALAAKQRKLNMLVQRELPQRITGSTFGALAPTNNVADAISAIALDPYLGRRATTEVDFDNIYSTIAAVNAYFGTSLASDFNYTFDTSNLSFEEMVSMIAASTFCVAYRRGSQLKLSFERETDTSTLLFNHRNKTPGSEKRTVTFGNQNDFDGVALDWIDPDNNDAVTTFHIPSDQSAANASKIQTVGIRSKLKAHFHAWRAWNKIRYQRVATNFTALQEADVAIQQDRILVADNTRPETQDGEITAQNLTQITLSQPATFEDGNSYTIFLQHYDGTVQSIGIASQIDKFNIVLESVPTLPLAVDPENYAKSTYIIVANDDPREQAFLLSEKTPQDNFLIEVSAINYDMRYYQNDLDYRDGIIDSDGEPSEDRAFHLMGWIDKG